MSEENTEDIATTMAPGLIQAFAPQEEEEQSHPGTHTR